MSELVLRNDNDPHIACLTLNRPERLNPLSRDMLAALDHHIAQIKQDKSVRVVILRGAGKGFCAGHDLKEMRAMSEGADKAETLKELFAACTKVMLGLRDLPQPVIAEVQGLATAAGCQLVATCDLAVASDTAKFGVNGVNIGLFCSTPMVALSRNIPRKHAFQMLTTGGFITASRAAELGLINRAVPAETLRDETRKLAQVLASKLDAAVKIGKPAFYRQAEMGLEEAYDYTADVMVQNMLRDDTGEGVRAFLEKRRPSWATPED